MTRRPWLLALLLTFCTAAVAQEVPATQPGELIKPSTAAGPVEKPEDANKPLITIQKGDLPIILSAPHGGRKKVPGSAVRTGKNILIKKGVKNTFTMAYDPNVDVVAQQLADELEKRTGKRPYVVIANFSRRYVDANRGPTEGAEDAAGQAVYDEYHGAIQQFRSEILQKFGQRGLIIDIHGHGRPGESGTIIRGTADWNSVRHLVEEFGKESIVGEGGLLGPLNAAGNKFLPACDQLEEKEYPSLNGGYITREYGSFAGGNFDAIQFELGGDYRKLPNIPKFVSTLADGFVPFTNKYLLMTEPVEKK